MNDDNKISRGNADGTMSTDCGLQVCALSPPHEEQKQRCPILPIFRIGERHRPKDSGGYFQEISPKDMRISPLKTIFGWLAVAAAILSAGLWFWAANVKLDAAEFGAYGGATPNSIKQFSKQARLNSWAAIATGVSAILQAISLALPAN